GLCEPPPAEKCAHRAGPARTATGARPIERGDSVARNFMEGEFTVGEFIAYKTAVRMATLLLGTLSIGSAAAIAFLRKHPRIARGYSQQNLNLRILALGSCLGKEGEPDFGLVVAVGSRGNLSVASA